MQSKKMSLTFSQTTYSSSNLTNLSGINPGMFTVGIQSVNTLEQCQQQMNSILSLMIFLPI